MLSVKQIREANPQGTMSMHHECTYGESVHMVVFTDGTIFEFATAKEARLAFDKLYRLGYERDYNWSTDETDGLVQAAELGENPFACTIMF